MHPPFVARRSNFAVLALTLGLTLASSCSGDQRAVSSGPSGGTLVIAVPAGPDNLMPPLTVSQVGHAVADLVFDHLAQMGDSMHTVGDGGFQPELASHWTWASDSLSVAFHLNPQARWHDGVPVRAADVQFSLALYKNPKVGSPVAPLLANVDSISTPDSLTAVAWFHRRTPEEFFDIAYQLWVVPRHVLDTIPPDRLGTSDAARHPIGSGRFRFMDWKPGSRLELIADTGNYRGRARLDRVIWSVAPDGQAAFAQVMSGQADLLLNATTEELRAAANQPSLRRLAWPSLQYGFLGMNLRDPTQHARPNAFLSDLRVRRAISMALDRRAMLQSVFDSMGALGHGPFPAAASTADTTLRVPPFDTAAAAALLDSAGWIRGRDGIRMKAGRRFAVGLLVPSSSETRQRYAVLIQEALRQTGIDASIQGMAFGPYVQRLTTGNFDLVMDGVGIDPNIGAVLQAWGTGGAPPNGLNFLGYSSPRVDALMDSATSSFNPVRARAYTRQAYQQIADDVPAVWLYDALSYGLISRRFQVPAVRPDGWWKHLADWTVPVADRIDRDRIGLGPPKS
ncbi:MAG TPA: peptide ABC transporter substrate-binding protein [Gemmatimonadaceae bacterium]|nr:peptide ABC transporter substrate-binding protein [Gemmatimonadaceae bacterium]